MTAPAQPRRGTERLYDFLTEEDDGSACESIPAGACTDVPRNFFLNALNGAATKLGEQLASPSLVLPWMMDALGVPAYLTGLLVPVRESMSLLPQLAIAGRIRRFEKRKWFWAGGGAAFGLGFLLMIPAALMLPPVWDGVVIVLLLAVGSMGRGLSSVAYKDVLAKTVPQGRRGTLLALRAAAGGILTLVAGILLHLYVADAAALRPYLLLLGTAGALWLVGVLFAAAVQEQPGATGGARNALQQVRSGFHLLLHHCPRPLSERQSGHSLLRALRAGADRRSGHWAELVRDCQRPGRSAEQSVLGSLFRPF